MRSKYLIFLFVILLSSVAFADDAKKDDTETKNNETPKSEFVLNKSAKRKILGWMERIVIQPEKAYLDSKLTPGSEGNVLHATNIKRFKRNGKSWVSFTTLNRKGEEIKIERPVVNKANFKTTSGKVEERIKVKSGICLSNIYMELEFALSDRSNFEHEVRIGRDALAGHFLVDPARTKVSKPKCKSGRAKQDVGQ